MTKRRNWLYRPVDSHFVRRVTFDKPVTKQQAHDIIVKQLKQLPAEMWAR